MAIDRTIITPVTGKFDELKRVEPEIEPRRIDPDDVSQRSGNVVLTFGYPGSGKTTFQWFLINYLLNSDSFTTSIVVPDGYNGGNYDGLGLINYWKRLWIEGRFPEATRVSENDIREVQCKVVPRLGSKKEVEFSFLEISGELLKAAEAKDNNRPDLVPTLRAFLNNAKINLILVLMLHPNSEENDILFPSLIAFLDKEFANIRDRISLAIVVSKPEESLEKLRKFGSVDGRFDYPKLDAEALEDYMNRFCGQTFQIWRSWSKSKRNLLNPLSLGKILSQGGEMKLVGPNFRNIEQIFEWIYSQFTGSTLGKNWWQRALDNWKFK